MRANSAIPCALTELGSDLRVVRFEAMNKLIEYFSEAAPVIAPATAQSVRRLVTDALHDSDVEVRGNTAVAVGMHGTAEWIPLLQEVAEADPAPEIEGRPVRKSAGRAIRRIQERMAKK